MILPSRTALTGLLAVALVAQPRAGRSQESYNPYDQIYGPPVDVPLEELAQGTVPFEGRPVRTRGILDMRVDPGTTARSYTLRDAGFTILLSPRPEIASAWSFEATRLLGRRLEVVGLFQMSVDMAFDISGVLEFWSFGQSSDDRASRKRARIRTVTLEMLVAAAEWHAGSLVRVAGEFRGTNLFGDLAASSQRSPGDWVLRDGFSALWVTGKSPRGDGFRLDPRLRRDTGKWLEVVGRVAVDKGTVYLRAQSVALGLRPPQPPAAATAVRPEGPREPPQVVFSLPLDGEGDVPLQSRFIVQFNNDMDEATFAGKVVLRYAGPPLPGDRAFSQLAATYDGGLRALTIDPGDVLRPGRVVELELLAGIRDLAGQALLPRSGAAATDVIEALHFSTVSTP